MKMTDTAINRRMLDWIVLTSQAETVEESTHGRSWSATEDQFLVDHYKWMTDEELGAHLGRSANGVHLRWERELHMPVRSKAPDVISANHAAWILGIDGHATAWWFDAGLLKGHIMPGDRKIRLIDRTAFRRWALNPMNWIYFHPKKVRDPELKRMIQLRKKRWGNEWWKTGQVAAYHGVDYRAVNHNVQMGRLKSYTSPIAHDGRHADAAWRYHFFLKSDAIHATFYTRENPACKPTKRALRWVKKARRLGWSWEAIGRSMGGYSGDTIHKWATKYIERSM